MSDVPQMVPRTVARPQFGENGVSKTAMPGSDIFPAEVWCRLAASLKLTPRELEVVRGIFDDEIESAMASNLGISKHTAHTHLRRIFGKLRVRTRVGVAVRIFRETLDLASCAPQGFPSLCKCPLYTECPYVVEALLGIAASTYCYRKSADIASKERQRVFASRQTSPE